MPDGQVLEFTRVTKRFNDVAAVSDFSARVEPGVVTAFLGPNGAGKTTTLRMLLGQVRPTSGTATIGGASYADLRHPLQTIGAVLEEAVYRPRRTASRQLTIAAKANGIPVSRVDEVLSLVGLAEEGEGRIGSFSLGMRQRLSVAHALLGDPGAMVFDEPANGLDPEGIRWMRLLMRRLADEGRTVLVSSHVLSEVEQVADNVLVLSKGRLVLSSGIETLADPSAGSVVVDAVDRAGLTAALAAAGFEVEVLRSGLTVRGGDTGTVGAIAASAGIALSTLVQRGPTLEDVFIELVRGGKLAASSEASAPLLAAPVTDAPVSDAPVTDVTIADAPVADAPVTDAPVTDVTIADAPEQTDPVAEAEPAEVDPVAEGAGVADEDKIDATERAVDESDDDEATTELDASSGDGGIPSSEVPASPSFDDILFGAAAPAVAAAGTDEASILGGDTEHTAPVDVVANSSEDDTASDEPSGIEFFATVDDETDESFDESEAADSVTESEESPSEASEQIPSSDDSVDPRSAAVSSMLADAARAYYEDEPRDYPVAAPADAVADEQTSDDEAQDDEAQDSLRRDADG